MKYVSSGVSAKISNNECEAIVQSLKCGKYMVFGDDNDENSLILISSYLQSVYWM